MKSVKLPLSFDYPLTVSDCFIETDHFIAKGQELLKLRTAAGKQVAIKAPCDGLISKVRVKNGDIVDDPTVIAEIDDDAAVSVDILAKQEAWRDRKRQSAIRPKAAEQQAKPATQPTAPRTKSPLGRRKPAINAKPMSALPLYILMGFSALLILIIGSRMELARGPIFLSHLGLMIAVGIIPTALVWWLIRQHNANLEVGKKPRGLALVLAVLLSYGATLFSTFDNTEKANIFAVLEGIPTPDFLHFLKRTERVELTPKWFFEERMGGGRITLGISGCVANLDFPNKDRASAEGLGPSSIDMRFRRDLAEGALIITYRFYIPEDVDVHLSRKVEDLPDLAFSFRFQDGQDIQYRYTGSPSISVTNPRLADNDKLEVEYEFLLFHDEDDMDFSRLVRLLENNSDANLPRADSVTNISMSHFLRTGMTFLNYSAEGGNGRACEHL